MTATAAARLEFELHQTFRYRYAGPVARVDQRLVVVPPPRHGGQVRRSHQLSVVGATAEANWSRDPFANSVARVRVPEVDGQVEFHIHAIIERDPLGETKVPAAARSDPRYLLATRLTTPDDAISAAANDAASGAASIADAAERLCLQVHRRLHYRKGATSVFTTAAEALAIGAGVCQDHAHLMLAMCRSLGIPARYVSGHMLGEGSTHAWVEVIFANPQDERSAVAVAFDPCHGRRVDHSYVVVAVGRDYLDVAPVSGTYFGHHANELSSSTHLTVRHLG
ncbi:MAG: transglutaminase family protein [bacterium]